MIRSTLVIALGAAIGAWLRWVLAIRLNDLIQTLPAGTLVANLVGGYIIGVVLAVFAVAPADNPALRLFIVTGFCGGLTTFYTFSAETIALIGAGRLLSALLAIIANVLGTLTMTALGLRTVRLLICLGRMVR